MRGAVVISGSRGTLDPQMEDPTDLRRLHDFEIAARRLTVGQLYLARVGQATIANQLKVNQATISRDIAWLKKKWLKDASQDVALYLARELAELDEMERQVALAFGKHNGGHPRWIEVRLKIKERKAAILGLNRNIIELRGSKDSPLELNIADVRQKRWDEVREALRDALGPLGDQETEPAATEPEEGNEETVDPENLAE